MVSSPPTPMALNPPNAPADEADADGSRREVARYLAHMTAELGAMARATGFDLLAYFLDMARIEAKIQADQPPK